jgi:hypothetical protein
MKKKRWVLTFACTPKLDKIYVHEFTSWFEAVRWWWFLCRMSKNVIAWVRLQKGKYPDGVKEFL